MHLSTLTNEEKYYSKSKDFVYSLMLPEISLLVVVSAKRMCNPSEMPTSHRTSHLMICYNEEEAAL